MSRLPLRLWQVATAVPLGVFIHDKVLGLSVVKFHNGGNAVEGFLLPPTVAETTAAKPALPSLEATVPSTCVVLRSGQFTLKNVAVGDVVVIRSPVDPDVNHVLRVKELPGKIVRARNGHQYFVRPSRYWLEADEAVAGSSTTDSCMFGGCPGSMLEGNPLFVLWPLSNFGPVRFTKMDNIE